MRRPVRLHRDPAVRGPQRPAQRGEDALVPGRAPGRPGNSATAVLDEQEGEHRIGHRHLHLLALAGSRPVEQRGDDRRSEEHTSELQSRRDLVCRLLLEKKKKKRKRILFQKKKKKKNKKNKKTKQQ